MSTNRPYEDPASLAGLFIYDAESGRLFHAKDKRAGRGRVVAARAGTYADTCTAANGYRRVSVTIDGKRRDMLAHRVAWILSHGAIPDGMQVDHVNGIRDDNRLCNLRLVLHQENAHNRRAAKGYCWHSRAGRWTAQIHVGGRKIHLGYHTSEDAARAAYLAAKAQLHPTAPLHLYH